MINNYCGCKKNYYTTWHAEATRIKGYPSTDMYVQIQEPSNHKRDKKSNNKKNSCSNQANPIHKGELQNYSIKNIPKESVKYFSLKCRQVAITVCDLSSAFSLQHLDFEMNISASNIFYLWLWYYIVMSNKSQFCLFQAFHMKN